MAQIRLQVAGQASFSSEETAKALGLSDEQKQKLTKIDEELSERAS